MSTAEEEDTREKTCYTSEHGQVGLDTRGAVCRVKWWVVKTCFERSIAMAREGMSYSSSLQGQVNCTLHPQTNPHKHPSSLSHARTTNSPRLRLCLKSPVGGFF